MSLESATAVLLVDTIVEGRHTDAFAAIGRASVEVLLLAADRCERACQAAMVLNRPASGYRQRGQFCRRRLRAIQPTVAGNSHTVRL